MKAGDKLGSKELTRRAVNWFWYLLRPPMWAALKEKLALFAFLGQVRREEEKKEKEERF